MGLEKLITGLVERIAHLEEHIAKQDNVIMDLQLRLCLLEKDQNGRPE